MPFLVQPRAHPISNIYSSQSTGIGHGDASGNESPNETSEYPINMKTSPKKIYKTEDEAASHAQDIIRSYARQKSDKLNSPSRNQNA
jgi:hypothetical protein